MAFHGIFGGFLRACTALYQGRSSGDVPRAHAPAQRSRGRAGPGGRAGPKSLVCVRGKGWEGGVRGLPVSGLEGQDEAGKHRGVGKLRGGAGTMASSEPETGNHKEGPARGLTMLAASTSHLDVL